MDAIFVDGLPAKITIHDFRRYHLQSFPALADMDYDGLISNAIDTVYDMFPGIEEMWDLHRDRQIWYNKTVLCYRLLTAWLIAEQYPTLTSNPTGGDIIKQKKVDGVAITFNTEPFKGANLVDFLRSNAFGRQALMMIQTAPRRALLRVTRFA
jgi:hypothetical protein